MLIVKVPGYVSKKESRDSGEEIIKELRKISRNEKSREIRFQVEEIHLDNSDTKEKENLISKNSKKVLGNNRVVFLGGDHSITYPILKDLEDYCLVVFDAYPDCLEGDRGWLRILIEGGLNPENVLLVGVRNYTEEEFEFLKKNKIKVVGMNELKNDLEEMGDVITEFCEKKTYFSLDMNVLDPVFAPSGYDLVPGGLDGREIIYLMSRLCRVKDFLGGDLVEIDKIKDKKFGNRTFMLAGKIISEIF
jgi:arginase family enzyme